MRSRYLAALAMAVLPFLPNSPTAAQDAIKIGVLQPMTGVATKNGTENFTAMSIARDMVNERGGVNGRKIELLLADIPTPTAAVTETERLITKEGVRITLGSGVSQLAIPVSQAAEKHGVVHWETAGAADIITKRGFKHTFQVGPSGRRYAEAAVDVTIEELSKKLGKAPGELRVALLWENRAFGKSVGDAIRPYAKEKGLNLVFDEGYDQTATDMTPIVQRLKDVRPDVVLAISFPNDAILFQRKAKELDFNTGAFVGVSAGYSNPDLRDSIGDMVLGILVSDFAAKVNPKALSPRNCADRRGVLPPLRPEDEAPAGRTRFFGLRGHLGAVHRGAAEGEDLRACRGARDRAEARSAGRFSRQRRRNQVHKLRLAAGSKGCRSEPAQRNRRVAVAEKRKQPGVSAQPGDPRH